MKAAAWGALTVPVCTPGSGTLRAPPSRGTAIPGTWGCAVGPGRVAQGSGRQERLWQVPPDLGGQREKRLRCGVVWGSGGSQEGGARMGLEEGLGEERTFDIQTSSLPFPPNPAVINDSL